VRICGVRSIQKGIVEPVIGQIKQARGFRQFLLRGFEKVQGEWSLMCTTHNILSCSFTIDDGALSRPKRRSRIEDLYWRRSPLEFPCLLR
jgi:hypothetical protein